ncbi:MAG: shikimate kinase [Candidatus Sericytochromatia bacterium]
MTCHVLLGPSGVGKSTLGPRVACLQQQIYLELDQLLQGPSGQPAAVMLNLWGPVGFYRRSLQALKDLAVKPENYLVDIGAGTQWAAARERDLLSYPSLCLWRNPEEQWRLNQILRQDPRDFKHFCEIEYSPARETLYRGAEKFCDLTGTQTSEEAWVRLEDLLTT